jgi:uncharacterized DUF497 family protein
MIQIDGLSWDERAEDHIARHSVRFEEVEQAVEGRLHIRRSGSYLLVIGQAHSERYLTVVLDHEGDGIWYPVTARDCSDSERRLARRRTQR